MEELFLLVRKYEVDYGIPFYFPFLKISILQIYDDTEVSRSLSELVPSILGSAIIVNGEDEVRPCELPKTIKPRFASFDVPDSKKKPVYRAKMEYPFRPGVPDWETFWRQMRSDFLNLKSHGEFVGNPTLKLLAARDICASNSSNSSILERLMLPRFNGGF